jgi:hypothetical protein
MQTTLQSLYFNLRIFFSENLPDSEEATLISIIKQDVPGLAGPDLRNTIFNVVFYIFLLLFYSFQLLSNQLFGLTETKRLDILKEANFMTRFLYDVACF